MKRLGLASVSLLGWIALARAATAQSGTPPLPPPPPPPPAAAPAPGTAPGASTPAPAATPSDGATSATAGAPAEEAPAQSGPPPTSATASGEADAGFDVWDNSGSDPEEEADAPEAAPDPGSEGDLSSDAWRKRSLHIQNTIDGSTGLLRVSEAGSGAPGTFRISLMTSFFSGSGVLCGADAICPADRTRPPEALDDLDHMTAHLGLSATVLPFLEARLGFHNKATFNSRGRPRLLQVLGDTNLGLKGFMPAEPDRPFSFGGELDLWLLNGTGGVGLESGGTSFAVRAIGTFDPTNRINPADRIPLRAHLNLGYRFDNSGSIVEDLENEPPPRGRGGDRITRIERFGLDINRVDFFEVGIGAEYVHAVVRPFIEWTLEAPLNRQDYVCNLDEVALVGDECLGPNEGFGVSPSRLTFGARLFPWEGRGLAVLAAFDVGTGATTTFVEEVAPELPWNLWLSVAYAIDTQPPKPVIRVIEAPPAGKVVAPAPEQTIQGVVREKGTETAVPNAIVRYDGRALTGMVTDDSGVFRTRNLGPGTYTFNVSAPGYRDGQCAATIAAGAPGAPATPPSTLPPQPVAPGAPAGLPGDGQVVSTTCELEALPRVGNIVGSLMDGETQAPVPSARIKITDRLGRELELQGDTSGAFRFENVPPGRVKLTIDAPGYFQNTTELTVKSREDLPTRIQLNKRPAQPNVVVQGREVKLRKQVHFQNDSAEILPDSMALLEEIADVLKTRSEIQSVEVQGHTDNTGTPLYNQRLSQNRAQAVVDALVRLGIDPSRLSARGYGPDKPLLPNTTEQNRSRNRRVQLMIQN